MKKSKPINCQVEHGMKHVWNEACPYLISDERFTNSEPDKMNDTETKHANTKHLITHTVSPTGYGNNHIVQTVYWPLAVKAASVPPLSVIITPTIMITSVAPVPITVPISVVIPTTVIVTAASTTVVIVATTTSSVFIITSITTVVRSGVIRTLIYKYSYRLQSIT